MRHSKPEATFYSVCLPSHVEHTSLICLMIFSSKLVFLRTFCESSLITSLKLFPSKNLSMLLSVVGKYIVILGSLSLSLYAFVAQLLIKIGIYYNTFWKQGQVWRVLYWPLMEGSMTSRTVSDPDSWTRHCQASLCRRYCQQPLLK